jgi:hypothetical protein
MRLPLLFSLVANAALLAAVALPPLFRTPSPAAPSPTGDATSPTAAPAPTLTTRAADPSSSATATAAARALPTDTWSSLHSDDPATLAANLRATGFPEEIVRNLVWRRVHELFSDRQKALQVTQHEQPYWRNQQHNSPQRADFQAAQRALNDERNALAESILGPTPAPTYPQAWHIRQFGSLAPEKITALQRIQTDYGELQRAVGERARGLHLPEDTAEINFLRREQEADIAALLSPDEYRAYQLRASPTAHQLRNEFSRIELTEAQYQNLFDLRRPFDERFSPYSGRLTPEQQKERADAEAALREGYRQVLDAESFAEYERSRDGHYQQLSLLTDRFDLPRATAIAVNDLRKTAEQEIIALRDNPELTPAERTARLHALHAAATRTLQAALGERPAQIYLENQAHWLRNIAPPPPPGGG